MKTPEKEAATPLLSPTHQDPKTARSKSLRFQGIATGRFFLVLRLDDDLQAEGLELAHGAPSHLLVGGLAQNGRTRILVDSPRWTTGARQ